MTDALALLKGVEIEPSSHEVLRLAAESNCSAYDCEFIAVAGDLNVPLITGNRQLLIPFCIQDDIKAARRRRRRLTASKSRSRRRGQHRCRLNAN